MPHPLDRIERHRSGLAKAVGYLAEHAITISFIAIFIPLMMKLIDIFVQRLH